MTKSSLKKLKIRKFRALDNIDIDLGTHVTVICGKNGTSKSSILGIAAQIFSFEKNYETKDELSFVTITGENFKSQFSEHFRFSERFDLPGSLDVSVELFDGYTGQEATAELELSKRTDQRTKKVSARAVVRKNSTVTKGNASRNFTHPVIFLSLRRLQPIASRQYNVCSFDYLNLPKNNRRFIGLNNRLLNKVSSTATSTSGSINSAVAHGSNFDQDSVSAGEDNAGQIVLALMSFRKLKEEYPDYKGGLLLIDEADAGLFPAAQLALLDILGDECADLDLQVILTSHSPTMIERIHDLSTQYRRRYKTVYLTDTYGTVQAINDISWSDIYADLHTATTAVSDETSLPVVNVYFEDNEAQEFFKAIMYRSLANKFITLMDVSLSCTNYISLIRAGVPEFKSKSLVVLDGDVKGTNGIDSIVLLPSSLPPDQLLFEFLYNLPADDQIWKNTKRFNRPVLIRVAAEIIQELGIDTDQISLANLVESYRAQGSQDRKVRDMFKDFYKNTQFQSFLKLPRTKGNPWKYWIDSNKELAQAFRKQFNEALQKTMKNGFNVIDSKVAELNN